MSVMLNDRVEHMFIEILNRIDPETYDFAPVFNSTEGNKTSYQNFGTNQTFKIYLRSFDGLSVFTFFMMMDNRFMITSHYLDDTDEDDDFYIESEILNFPRTDEEYFQYSTIQDLFFSLEFYNKLKSVLEALRVKWKDLP